MDKAFFNNRECGVLMKKLFVALVVICFSSMVLAHPNSPILDSTLKSAESGNLRALNQSFRLLAKSDGAVAEDASIAIGKSIQKNPRNFLLVLKKNKKQIKNLDSLLGNLGDDYVDDLPKQKAELEARLNAVQSVKASSLKKVRADCEATLQRLIAHR